MSEIESIQCNGCGAIRQWNGSDCLTFCECMKTELAQLSLELLNYRQQDRIKTREVNLLVAENRKLATQVEIREKALRDIKAVHTRWYHGGQNDGGYAANTMEEIAVSVWQREDLEAEANYKRVVCKACGCTLDVHGCGCNPHDA